KGDPVDARGRLWLPVEPEETGSPSLEYLDRVDGVVAFVVEEDRRHHAELPEAGGERDQQYHSERGRRALRRVEDSCSVRGQRTPLRRLAAARARQGGEPRTGSLQSV